MTPEEANAILAKRFGMKQPVVAQPGMYVRSPQSQPSIFPNSQPQLSKAEQLIKAARERLMNAGGAARMKMREQLEQGYGGQLGDGTYYPEDTSAVADYIRKTVPASQLVGMRRPDAGSVNSVRVVPGIGHMTEIQAARGYTDAGKVMTGNRGSGSVVFGGPRKPATFDGMSKEQFFGQAAARQGVDNKYARADKAVLEAIKQGGAKGKEKKD